MKLLSILVLMITLAACSAPSDPTLGPTAPAADYFYPPTNGVRYVYSQDNSTTPTADTSTYQVVVGNTFGSYAKLVINSDSANGGSVLYYYKVSEGRTGTTCILSQTGSDQGIIALQGSLEIGSSWNADAAGQIVASVVGRYAEYYLPGRQQVYHDVVAVKYIDASVTDSSYMLRLFARDFGLILEQTITNDLVETSNLQLIDRLGATNGVGAPIEDHGHWYDERGRYAMPMNPDNPNYR